VGSEIIHDDDFFALERWNQTLLDIRQEELSGHRAVNHEGCCQSVAAQSGNERDRLPMSVRYATDQALPAWATAAEPHHFSIGRGLVDEH